MYVYKLKLLESEGFNIASTLRVATIMHSIDYIFFVQLTIQLLIV